MNPPVPFLSGGRIGAGEGGGPGIHRAELYRIGRLVPRPMVCLSSETAAELWVPRAATAFARLRRRISSFPSALGSSSVFLGEDSWWVVDPLFWFAGDLLELISFGLSPSIEASAIRVRLSFLPLLAAAGASVPVVGEAAEWIWWGVRGFGLASCLASSFFLFWFLGDLFGVAGSVDGSSKACDGEREMQIEDSDGCVLYRGYLAAFTFVSDLRSGGGCWWFGASVRNPAIGDGGRDLNQRKKKNSDVCGGLVVIFFTFEVLSARNGCTAQTISLI